MSLTYTQGQVVVARTIGGQNDADQLAAAGTAILNTLEEWNLRRNWRFLLMDNSDDPIDVSSGTATYSLPTPFKRPYSARLISLNRALQWVEQRHVDRIIRDQTATGNPTHYTLYNASTTFDASSASGQTGTVKLVPTPGYTQADELLVRYYRPIALPSAGGNTLDLPDRYVYAMLTMAKYYFLVDKDAESARTQWHKLKSEELWKAVVADDEVVEDREVRLIPQVEYGQAYGSADLPPDTWNY